MGLILYATGFLLFPFILFLVFMFLSKLSTREE